MALTIAQVFLRLTRIYRMLNFESNEIFRGILRTLENNADIEIFENRL
jgi:uncharacterized protein (DUF736 family)